MESNYKRRLSELLVLYSLEPELCDIYVEGISDKLIIERFLLKNKITEFTIIEIDSIDFAEVYQNYSDAKRNNKKKLIALSLELRKANFTKPLKKLTLIIDKDFDEFLGEQIKNEYLLYTDFACLEMYVFNEHCIEIFYKTILRRFPITAKTTLRELSKVLVNQFLLRLILQIKEVNEPIVDIKKSIHIDRSSGEIEFDFVEYLKKILHSSRKYSHFNEYSELLEEYKTRVSKDDRNQINGHDFLHLFCLYINRIKNGEKINEEILDRVLFQCIDYSELKRYGLFLELLIRYKR